MTPKTWKDNLGRELYRLGELPVGTVFEMEGFRYQVQARAKYIGGSVSCKYLTTGEIKRYRYYRKVIVKGSTWKQTF